MWCCLEMAGPESQSSSACVNHNITLNDTSFVFSSFCIAENSATGREDKPPKCNNSEPLQLLDNTRRVLF